MPSYTLIVVIYLSICLLLDLGILRTRLILSSRFLLFIPVVIILQTLVDNYLNGRWLGDGYIVGEYAQYSGIKIWHTPIENYFYGIALIWSNLIIYTWLTKRINTD